ncbi:MAG: 4'-phosphopantetheinyl transferase superfamily protein [Flavobacteriaceae bacterium]|nr:4'-phosphopantetheinyl transferase superfamily protein [Flavobacteriaceae bacterium]MDA0331529.1 4'-phosphopantetheinyl transferase superfamily protein [Bacteroidota bacterium]|tara:strand:+ start:251 stop:868 length:618 start_codon:yes stop_codon:yes gene_type:complete
MPFLKDFIINNSTKILLWKIIPGELDETQLSMDDKSLLKTRKGKKSKEYFLAVRKLIKNEDPEIIIKYDLNGKPYLNIQKGISISHSNKLVAICISNEIDFGIDVQYKTNKILNIQNKFLSYNEKKNLGYTNSLESLIKLWSAKESIYKALGKKGISFSNDLEIDIKKNKDLFKVGYYKKDNNKIKFDLSFFNIDEYIICYADKS